jgi:hypothetical protein
VCLETIEHIKEQFIIPGLAERLGIKRLFISFPSKKTTHYNKFHFYDYNTQQICDMFPNYELVDEIELHREVKILNFIRKYNFKLPINFILLLKAIIKLEVF